jgi:hypothetical protein
MTTIDVTEKNQGSFHVTVTAGSTTEHVVTVDAAYAQQLTSGQISTIDLVRQSFEFLVERESNKSIMRRFDLTIINRYFPQYEQLISQ